MKESRPDPQAAPRRRLRAAALPVAALALFAAAGAGRVQEPASGTEDVRAVLEKWLETERLIQQERSDRPLKRDLLQSRMDLLGAEIAAVREGIAADEAAIAAAGSERRALEEDLAAREAAAADFAADVARLEARTRALVARLPEAAVERVRALLPRIPEDPAATKESLGARYLTVLGVLVSLNKFNLELLPTRELRTMPDGSAVEVDVLYAGLSCAWYVSADRRHAGVGAAGPAGWVWTPADDRAEEIARTIAIQSGAQEADFVRVPLESR
jgi:hypothetical protein